MAGLFCAIELHVVISQILCFKEQCIHLKCLIQIPLKK
jgi:hypothetical protein